MAAEGTQDIDLDNIIDRLLEGRLLGIAVGGFCCGRRPYHTEQGGSTKGFSTHAVLRICFILLLHAAPRC